MAKLKLSLSPAADAAVSAPAAVVAVCSYTVTTKAGKTTEHTRETVRGLFGAPVAVRNGVLMSADMLQLTNGNFAPIRDGLKLFTGKALVSLQSLVTVKLTVQQDNGLNMVPVIAWDNVRAKSVAIAIAESVSITADLKGKKLAFQGVCNAWLVSMAPVALSAPAADAAVSAPAADAAVSAPAADAAVSAPAAMF